MWWGRRKLIGYRYSVVLGKGLFVFTVQIPDEWLDGIVRIRLVRIRPAIRLVRIRPAYHRKENVDDHICTWIYVIWNTPYHLYKVCYDKVQPYKSKSLHLLFLSLPTCWAKLTMDTTHSFVLHLFRQQVIQRGT
jgi:hypothetical protein